jgi:hypothetical protein
MITLQLHVSDKEFKEEQEFGNQNAHLQTQGDGITHPDEA